MRRRFIQAEFYSADGSEFHGQAVPEKSVCTLRWNATSTGYLTVPEHHPVLPALVTEEGVRASVYMVTIDAGTLTSRRLVDGRVGTLTGEAPFGSVTIPVVDDFQDFYTLLGWQVPGAADTGQGAAEFARYTGKSEANAVAAIAANVARLGLPWDVANSGGRGTVQSPLELRMDSLADKILGPLINDKLQLRISRVAATGRFNVDVHQGQTFTRPLTPQSGVLQSWSWVKQPPTATRVVVGGHGTGVEREFKLVIAAVREAILGTKLEIFVEASGAEEGADLTPYGLEALAAHDGKAGLTAQMRETSWFQFPDAYDLGDVVPIQVGSLAMSDVISQIEITHDVGSGFSVVPTVGLATADPQARLVGFVQNVATSVAGLERR